MFHNVFACLLKNDSIKSNNKKKYPNKKKTQNPLVIDQFNRNMPNRRNGPPGARQKNDKLGAIKGGIRKRNPVSSAKKVLAKNAKDDASADANNSNLR